MHAMAHQHAGAHLMRRQRGGDDDDGPVVVVTQVMVMTEGDDAPEPTEKPGIALPAPATRARETTTTEEEEEPEETAKPTKPTTTARKPSSTQDSDDDLIVEETGTTKSPLKVASTLMVATKSPTPSAGSSIAGLASATAATISATASSSSAAAADSEEGMSTGAKAGLALGLLLAACAVLTGILLLYRRKKKQMAAAAAQENEKTEMYNAPHPPPPQVMAGAAPAASIRSARTASTAPRLSLRPVTQFDPAFNEQRKSGGNLLNVAAAAGGAAASSQNRNLSPSASAERPTSAWERRGAANAPAADPFKDPETQSGPPSANPFGNNAAVDTQQASIPDSPPNASPMVSAMHSTQPSTDFANPAPAIAAADVNAVALAGVATSSPPPKSELPPPPPVAANNASVPASPAWTEDIPASPGPAPTDPPPVAGAMAGARPQSPAPGPGPNNVHRVQLDFKPSMQDELDLHAGQLVRMLHEYDDGWVSLHFYFDQTTSLILYRLSAFVWTVRSKVLFPAHVSPSTQSSLVMARLVKALHKATCAALLSAHRWVPVVLSPVLSLQPVV